MNLSIEKSTVYWHLAIMRKNFNVHSTIELLHKLNKNYEETMTNIRLTPRGREVFELAMRGLSIEKISKTLGISYSAVLRHREKMLMENECNTMMELIAKHNCAYIDRSL